MAQLLVAGNELVSLLPEEERPTLLLCNTLGLVVSNTFKTLQFFLNKTNKILFMQTVT